METKTFSFSYSVVNTVNHDIIDMQRMDIALTEDDIKSIAEAMKQYNGGYEIPMYQIPNTQADYIGEEMIMDYQENHADEDFDWEDTTVEFEERMPEALLEAVNAYVPELKVTIDYYYHVGEKEKKVSVDWMMPRCYFDKMKAVALSPLNGMTPIDNMNKVDPTVVHAVNYYCLEKITPEMVEGINEGEEPYLKDFPWQVYENLGE